jgi:hypothetical protein
MLPKLLSDIPVIITTFLLIGKLVSDGYMSYYMGIGFIIIIFGIVILARYRANEGISRVVRTTFRVALPIVSIIILVIIYTGGDYYQSTLAFALMLYFILVILILFILLLKLFSREELNRRSVFFDCIMIIGASGLIVSTIMNQTISLETGVVILLVIVISSVIGQIFRGKTKRTLGYVFRFGIPLLALLFFVFRFEAVFNSILILLLIGLGIYVFLQGFFSKRSS